MSIYCVEPESTCAKCRHNRYNPDTGRYECHEAEDAGQNQGTKKNDAIKKRRAEVSVLLFCVANYCADIFSARKDFFEKRFELFMQTRHLSFGIEEMLTLDRLSKYWASSLKHELKQTPVSKYFLSSEILLPYNVHIWLTDCARMSILKRSEIPMHVKRPDIYPMSAKLSKMKRAGCSGLGDLRKNIKS